MEDPVQATARYWLVRQQSGDMTAAERRAFEGWLDADAEHRDAYAGIAALWDSLGEFDARQFPARSAARAVKRPVAIPWLTSAAAAVILAAITFGFIAHRDWHGEVDTYRTAKGEQKMVVLSDGSTVTLNTDTEVRVVYSRGSRTVHLERGQALFTVEHQAGRRFEVIAGSGRIVDLGTRFDVRLRDDRAVVTVTEGKVHVTTARTGPIHVSAGEGMAWSVRGDFLSHHAIDPELAVVWYEGRLNFDRTPLGEVMAELARYHPISYRFADSGLAALQVSGSFRTEDLELLFATLEAALPVRTRVEDGLVEIGAASS